MVRYVAMLLQLDLLIHSQVLCCACSNRGRMGEEVLLCARGAVLDPGCGALCRAQTRLSRVLSVE